MSAPHCAGGSRELGGLCTNGACYWLTNNVEIDVPEPVKVEGFKTLRYAEFADPEGNQVGLLDGS